MASIYIMALSPVFDRYSYCRRFSIHTCLKGRSGTALRLNLNQAISLVNEPFTLDSERENVMVSEKNSNRAVTPPSTEIDTISLNLR